MDKPPRLTHDWLIPRREVTHGRQAYGGRCRSARLYRRPGSVPAEGEPAVPGGPAGAVAPLPPRLPGDLRRSGHLARPHGLLRRPYPHAHDARGHGPRPETGRLLRWPEGESA